MAKKKRGNQEGSVFQRADGRWVAQVTVRDANGRRKQPTKLFHTQAEARRALTAMKSRQDSHKPIVTGKATLRDWLTVWLAPM